jgi:hypothetical protein
MPQYAADTSVSQEKSRAEIERTIGRYGADYFTYGWSQDKAMVGFVMNGRQIRFIVTVPDRDDEEFTLTETGRTRSTSAAEAAWEQAGRQRWRALALVIKAKLEAVESGIVSFDEEFGMHFLLPNGQTVGDWVAPQIDAAYETGNMPAMLPMLEAKKK